MSSEGRGDKHPLDCNCQVHGSRAPEYGACVSCGRHHARVGEHIRCLNDCIASLRTPMPATNA